MTDARILVSGLDATARTALLKSLPVWLQPRIEAANTQEFMLVAPGVPAANDADELPVVCFGADATHREALLTRGRLVYSAPGIPNGNDIATLFAELLQLQRLSTAVMPTLDVEGCEAVESLRAALARGSHAIGGRELRLHLASERCSALLCVGPEPGALCLNPHGDGLAAYALRCAASITLEHASADARAVAGLDFGPGAASDGLLVQAAGARRIGSRIWQLVISTQLEKQTNVPALQLSLLGLLDALCEPTEESPHALYGNSAQVFRTSALRAYENRNSAEPWPQFAPAWTRRLARYWRWPLVLAGLALFIPVAPSINGTGLVVFEGAPLLRATAQGEIFDVLSRLGQHVNAGQVLLRIRSDDAQADTAFADYRALLRQRLDQPQDDSIRVALAQSWERLQARLLQQHSDVLAPCSGHVVDLPLLLGHTVAPGDVIAAITPDVGNPQIELRLPAVAASRLQPGLFGEWRGADGRSRSIRLEAISRVSQGNGAAAQVLARASVVDAAELLPGSSGAAYLRLPTLPLVQALWQRWKEPAT